METLSKTKFIPKEPVPPSLSEEAIKLLTELCFGENEPLQKAEAIMVFGTPYPQCHRVCASHIDRAVLASGAKSIYFTGGIAKLNMTGRPESLDMLDAWAPSRHRTIQYRCDILSKHTVENVECAIALGLSNHKNIVFITKWGTSRRARLTLEKRLPDVVLQQLGYLFSVPDDPGIVDPQFWPDSARSVSLVWGEFLRIEEYGAKGYIAYPEEVRNMVKVIRRATGTKAA